MPQIKLIASDLDGTLLRNDKTLSLRTRAVLARCRERGILFFAATARPPRVLESKIDGLSYDGALCHNGGVAVLHGETIWEDGFPPEVALPLVRRVLREFPGVRISAEIGGQLYANFDCSAIWEKAEFTYTDFATLPNHPLDKLLIGLDFPGMAEKAAALLPEGLAGQVSENSILMVQPKGVEKGKALKAVRERLGISLSETAAFGDDWNDISLLRAAGIGVAVENALPEVKAAADEICGSNEDDGPAEWLENHLL